MAVVDVGQGSDHLAVPHDPDEALVGRVSAALARRRRDAGPWRAALEPAGPGPPCCPSRPRRTCASPLTQLPATLPIAIDRYQPSGSSIRTGAPGGRPAWAGSPQSIITSPGAIRRTTSWSAFSRPTLSRPESYSMPRLPPCGPVTRSRTPSRVARTRSELSSGAPSPQRDREHGHELAGGSGAGVTGSSVGSGWFVGLGVTTWVGSGAQGRRGRVARRRRPTLAMRTCDPRAMRPRRRPSRSPTRRRQVQPSGGSRLCHSRQRKTPVRRLEAASRFGSSPIRPPSADPT